MHSVFRGILVVLIGVLAALWATLALADFTVGERVRASVGGIRYDGTIIDMGSGDYSAYYFVKFDVGGQSYVLPRDMEALAPADEVAPDPAASATYGLGDRVEVSVDGKWFPATIIGLGSERPDGYYYVSFDSGTQEYAQPAYIRPLQAAPGETQVATAEPGLYVCTGFDAATYRWSLALGTNGVYQQQKPDTTAGYYTVKGDLIAFTSGNYADLGWFGRAENRDGQTILVLRSIANEQQGPRVNEYENIYCHIGQ